MKIEFDNTRIPELIVKSISSTCTKEEKDELNKWLSHKNNQDTYNKIVKAIKDGKHYGRYKSLDIHSSWVKILRQISTPRIYIFTKVLKYAAAILLPLIAATYLILQLANPPQERLIRRFSQKYLPGGSKARLVVENGKIFELEKLKATPIIDSLISIKNTGTSLLYSQLNNEIEKLQLEEEYHEIIIPTGGEYYLELLDGTKIWLNSETRIKYPKYLVANTRTIELEGEAYFEVASNPDKPFVVKTAEGLVKVLGTKFNIKAYKNEVNVTTLVEGNVNLRHRYDEGSEISLNPGDQATIIDVNHKIRLEQVDTYGFTAWKDKRFVFVKEPLESIFKKLSRWYSIDFEILDPKAKDVRISADIRRFDELFAILELIENVAETPIRFEVRNDVLYIASYDKEEEKDWL